MPCAYLANCAGEAECLASYTRGTDQAPGSMETFAIYRDDTWERKDAVQSSRFYFSPLPLTVQTG